MSAEMVCTCTWQTYRYKMGIAHHENCDRQKIMKVIKIREKYYVLSAKQLLESQLQEKVLIDGN